MSSIASTRTRAVGRTGGAQQVEPRGVAVVHLVAEAAHEVDVRLAAVERGERQPLDAQHARHDLPEAAEAGDDDRDVVLVDGVVGAAAPASASARATAS